VGQNSNLPPCFQDLQWLFYDIQYGKCEATDVYKHTFVYIRVFLSVISTELIKYAH